MSTIKLLAAVAIICLTVFGVLYAFGVVTIQTVTDNSIQVVGGVGVLIVSVIALKAISGRGPGGQTDPPPQL